MTGGDIYISVMTIISSVRQMVETPIHAINEGTSPVLSYNYGARRPDRVKKAGVVLIIMVPVSYTHLLPWYPEIGLSLHLLLIQEMYT